MNSCQYRSTNYLWMISVVKLFYSAQKLQFQTICIFINRKSCQIVLFNSKTQIDKISYRFFEQLSIPINKLPWNDKRGRMAKSVTCPLLQNHPSKYSRFQKDHLLWICEWEVSSMRILANDGAYDVCKIEFNSSEFSAVIITLTCQIIVQ